MNLAGCARGATHKLTLNVDASGHRVELPIIFVRGAQLGRTLVVTAGVHGDEYEGVRAILDTTRELDPRTMSGDLLCVSVCNPPAFWAVTRCSPLDGGNLARVFPGSADGSITEAIAAHIDREILSHADFYLDLHSAGVRCLMPTMVGYQSGDPRAEEAALAFGAPVIWAHDVLAPGRTVSAATARGIPWLYTEARGAGRIHPDDLAVYSRGILNLLHHLAVLPGIPETPAPQHLLFGDGNVDASITTDCRGFLIPEVRMLERVVRGQRLGTLYDLHGTVIEHFASPRDGVVALIHVCPAINSCDPLFLVAGVQSQ